MISFSKKKILFPLILILFLITAALFYFDWKKEKEVGLMLTKTYSQEEKEDVKIIKNNSAGLEMKIPKDWEVVDNVDSLVFISPDFEIHPRAFFDIPIPQKGCDIKVSVKKEIENSSYDIDYGYLKEQIDFCTISEEECGYELVEVDGNKGIKDIYSVDADLYAGDRISIQVPKEEKIYKFETYLFSEEAEYCLGVFNDFLDEVLIK